MPFSDPPIAQIAYYSIRSRDLFAQEKMQVQDVLDPVDPEHLRMTLPHKEYVLHIFSLQNQNAMFILKKTRPLRKCSNKFKNLIFDEI